jgi:hypothetical protein
LLNVRKFKSLTSRLKRNSNKTITNNH